MEDDLMKQGAIAMVRTDGMKLMLLSPKYQADKEVVMAAVQKDGKALQYASPELKQDKEAKEKLEDMPLEELLELEAKTDEKIAEIKVAIEREKVLRRVKDKIERVGQLKEELEALRRGERSVGQEHEDSIVK